MSQNIDSLLRKKAPSFSGQIAVIKNDSLLYSFQQGWICYPMQITMNDSALLEIGELSSHWFTRHLVRNSHEKIQSHSLVISYLQNFAYPNVKIHHLLNDSVALSPNYIKLYHRNIYVDEKIKLADKNQITNHQILTVLNNTSTPLQYNIYSNTNDIILALILEQHYLKNFDDIVNNYININFKSLRITANSNVSANSIINKAYGHLQTDSTHYIMQETLTDMGFKYNDNTYGHHHIYANAKDLAKYLNKIATKQETEIYKGHEPGFNSLFYTSPTLRIVILSNTSNEKDTEILLEILKPLFR